MKNAKQFEVGSFYNEHEGNDGFDCTVYYDRESDTFLLIDDKTDKVVASGSLDEVARAAEDATEHYADEIAQHIAGRLWSKGLMDKEEADSYDVDFSNYDDPSEYNADDDGLAFEEAKYKLDVDKDGDVDKKDISHIVNAINRKF